MLKTKVAKEFCLKCGVAKNDNSYASYHCDGHVFDVKSDFPDTWQFWTDVNGHEYMVGDKVACAGKIGEKAHMYIGTVTKINAKNSKGSALWRSKPVANGQYDAKGRIIYTMVIEPSATIQIKVLGSSPRMPRVKTFQDPDNVVLIEL